MTLFEKLIPVPFRIQSDSGSVVERSDHQLPVNLFGACPQLSQSCVVM